MDVSANEMAASIPPIHSLIVFIGVSCGRFSVLFILAVSSGIHCFHIALMSFGVDGHDIVIFMVDSGLIFNSSLYFLTINRWKHLLAFGVQTMRPEHLITMPYF